MKRRYVRLRMRVANGMEAAEYARTNILFFMRHYFGDTPMAVFQSETFHGQLLNEFTHEFMKALDLPPHRPDHEPSRIRGSKPSMIIIDDLD